MYNNFGSTLLLMYEHLKVLPKHQLVHNQNTLRKYLKTSWWNQKIEQCQI